MGRVLTRYSDTHPTRRYAPFGMSGWWGFPTNSKCHKPDTFQELRMALTINDFITGGVQNHENQNSQAKPKSEFWVNVGIERNGKLVSLPMGIALDKLEPRRIPGSSSKNQEFRFLRLAEADLWKKMQEIMASMKPGEVVTLPFQVELRRCEATEVVEEQDTTVNPFAVGPLTIK